MNSRLLVSLVSPPHRARVRLICATLLCSTIFGASTGSAQEDRWRASELQITHETRTWGPDCPPRLPARASSPGGEVITLRVGDVISFRGAIAGQSNQCWSDRPSLRRASFSYQGNVWVTTCRAPAPQSETATYRWSLLDNRMVFEERTEWRWVLNNSQCNVIRTARRELTRISGQAAVPPPPANSAQCTPGPAQSIRAGLPNGPFHPGERVCLRPRLVDAAGCALPTEVSATYAGTAGRLDGRCFTPNRTGSHRIDLNSGGIASSISIDVENVDVSDITARQLQNGAGDEETIEAQAGANSGIVARFAGGNTAWLWIAGAGIALLGIAVVFAMRKPKVVPVAAPFVKPQSIRPPTSHKKYCSVCGEWKITASETCDRDGARLLDSASSELRARGMICPKCRTGYPADGESCAHDGEELIPYAIFSLMETKRSQKKCPTCGTLYDAHVVFCGKDGTKLS